MRGIAHHWPDLFRKFFVLCTDLVEVDAFRNLEGLGDKSLIFSKRVEQVGEIHVDQVRDADAAAGDLVLVTRAYAARGSADGNTVIAAFRDFLDDPVKRKDDVGAVADAKLLFDVDSNCL